MRWQLASTFALTAMSGACYEPNRIVCENGALCPTTLACTENDPDPEKKLPLCGLEADVDSCVGLADYDACDSSVRANGFCRDSVCNDCVADLSVCHLDQFQSMTSPSDADLLSVWLVAPDLAYAVGATTIQKYEGRAWSVVATEAAVFDGVWASGGDLFAVGSFMLGNYVYRGVSPQIVGDTGSNSLARIWGTSPTDVIAVGSGTIGEFDGTLPWTWLSPTIRRLNDVSGTGSIAVAVGANEVHYRRSGTWSMLSGPAADQQLRGIWLASEKDWFVVARTSVNPMRGKIWRYRWTVTPSDGAWEAYALDPEPPPLVAVWGASGDEVYAVGEAGTVLHFNGTEWAAMATDPSINFNDIAGSGRDAIAVGQGGAIWRISR